jgi:glycosyltransferase involved in cell wall biosynthesis
MTPLVSVVIPTRNRRSLLAGTLDTVLAQQDADLEVVVVDEASTDGTAAYLQAHTDPRVRTVRHDEPQGVARARNRGIGEAGGRWVALLDDDDLWAPRKLAAQLAAADGATWVYTGAVAVDRDLQVVETYRPLAPAELCAQLPLRNPVPAGSSNVLIRRSAFDAAGQFDSRLRHLADWDMWRRLAQQGEPAVVDEPLVAYRIHPGNASQAPTGILEEAALVEQALGHPIDWVAIHRWIAINCLRSGARWQAARSFGRAVRAGDRRSVVRAANALLVPGAGRRITYHPLRRDGDVRDRDYKSRADVWLAPLRAAVR